MNAFTESTIAAAQRDIQKCVDALNAARCGDLTMLSSNVHRALVHAQMALEEIDRALKLEENLKGAAE